MAIKQSTTNELPDGEKKQICCPLCQQSEVYRLGDGRYKCKHCKKKFSANRLKSKVSIDKLNAVAEQFWAMNTAEQCAGSLAINRKTAQNYYARLRSSIAKENSRTLHMLSSKPIDKKNHPSSGKLPVFWSLLQNNRIRIIFPDALIFSLEKNDLPEIQGVSEIYTNSPSAKKNVLLDKFYRRTLWARTEADEKLLQDFWRQAKINLMKYRGGCKSRFPLFIEEMAFRFNHRESEGVIRLLQTKISESPSET